MNADLQARYNDFSHNLSDDALETWAELFCEDATYRLTSRRNHEMKLPLCTILCESRGALIDRIAAIRNTLVYAPRKVLHCASNVQIVAESGDQVQARSLFIVFQTFETGVTELQMVGRSFDTWRRQGERLKLLHRDAIFDTELVPGSVVYPA
jgi:3-phenylpropionate/cinnamic acid dioxygenase small subunit